jgi:tetratricopeptide (TPR) repeat protein
MGESSDRLMPSERLEALRAILSQNPADPLARYGLAMENVKTGGYEAAIAEFRVLLEAHPDYLYAYFHSGQTLEKLDRIAEAKETYRRGIEAAVRKGDAHAREELQAALDRLRAE